MWSRHAVRPRLHFALLHHQRREDAHGDGGPLIEHPFATIKRMTGGGRFLTRNLKGTRTEMALSVLAYNMLRAINIRAAAA